MEKEHNEWDGRERRRGPDKLLRVSQLLSLVSVMLFILSLLVLHYARPERKTGLVEFAGIHLRLHWSTDLIGPLIGLLWLCPLCTLFSLYLARKRTRRYTDNLGVNLKILLALTATLAAIITIKVLLE